jgi:hypothetical protein
MGRKTSIFLMILMLMTLSMIPQSMNGNIVRADPTNQELMDEMINIKNQMQGVEQNLTLLLNSIYLVIGYDGINSTIYADMMNLTNQIDSLNFSNIAELDARLDMLDDMISNINDRIGYPMSKPDATIYDDLSLILDGLTYNNNGVRYWALKNQSGVPYLQILGENQQLIANYQLSMNSTFLEELEDAQKSITSNANVQTQEIKESQGGTYMIALITLILILFFVAWKLYLKERFFPSSNPGFKKPANEGFGKPGCFGDPNECNPDINPNCSACKWLTKCKAACVRNEANGTGQTLSGLEAERDPQGNILAIYDEGERIDTPQCFGREYDPQTNRDCQECAINEFCAEQLNKNMQRVNIPPMRPSYQQQGMQQSGRRITPTRSTVGPSFGEDILQDF